MRGPKPWGEWQLGPLHDGAGRDGRLASAVDAFISMSSGAQKDGAAAATFAADEALTGQRRWTRNVAQLCPSGNAAWSVTRGPPSAMAPGLLPQNPVGISPLFGALCRRYIWCQLGTAG